MRCIPTVPAKIVMNLPSLSLTDYDMKNLLSLRFIVVEVEKDVTFRNFMFQNL